MFAAKIKPKKCLHAYRSSSQSISQYIATADVHITCTLIVMYIIYNTHTLQLIVCIMFVSDFEQYTLRFEKRNHVILTNKSVHHRRGVPEGEVV